MSNASETNEYPTIADLFGLLDRSRHLPAYQLERLAGAFFALFLPEVIEKALSKIKRPLIPEFPIKKPDNNQSQNVDYFALAEDCKRAFLIELKTDMRSIREKQIGDLQRTKRDKDLLDLIKDVKRLAQNPNKPTRQKYVHLLSHLRDLNLVCYDESKLYERAFADNSKGIYGIIDKDVKPASWVCEGRPKLEVIYIQPIRKSSDSIPSDWHCMYFDDLADHVREIGSMGRRFAESLYKWKDPAGSYPA